MFAFVRRKRADFIGLDISSEAIRLLQLSPLTKGWLIKKYAAAYLPSATIVDGKIQQSQVAQTVLARLVSETQTAACPAALAMPAHAVISQQIFLPPRLPALEYEIAIGANLERYFPGVSDALCFDFLATHASDDTSQEFFLVAARQWQVDSYAALVNSAGLQVKAVDVDRFALMRAVPFTVAEFTHSQVVSLLHFGMHYADLIIFSKQTILLQQRWHRDEALPLVEAVKQAFALYFSMRQKEVDYVVLSGEASEEEVALSSYFSAEVGLKIFQANPVANMRIASTVDKQQLQKDARNLLICCGLATRRFIG